MVFRAALYRDRSHSDSHLDRSDTANDIMTETETSGSVLENWGEALWSLGSILVPAACLLAGIVPTIMLGAVIGATIRFGTDLVLMATVDSTNISTVSHQKTVVSMLLIQFGVLIAGIGLAFAGHGIGIGITVIMLLTYLFAIIHTAVYGGQQYDDAGDSEWKFDIDDV